MNVPGWGVTFRTEEAVGDDLCAVGVRAHAFKIDEERNAFNLRIVEEIEQPFEWVLKFRYSDQQEGRSIFGGVSPRPAAQLAGTTGRGI